MADTLKVGLYGEPWETSKNGGGIHSDCYDRSLAWDSEGTDRVYSAQGVPWPDKGMVSTKGSIGQFYIDRVVLCINALEGIQSSALENLPDRYAIIVDKKTGRREVKGL